MPFENIFPRILYAVDDGGGAGGAAGGAQDQGAGAGEQGSKAPELPDDPAELKKLLLAEKEAHQHTIGVHTEMKTKLTKREQEDTKAKEESLKKAGEFEKLYLETSPKLEAATKTIERQETALAAYLKTELQAVPDSLKALIPEGDTASKLEWIAKAKAAGAFAPGTPPVKKGPDGNPPPGGAAGGTVTRAQFDAMTPDQRLAFSKNKGKVVD